jgi:3-hydroxyacyl-[acyl-carrier-protein] dehydratase
MDLSINEILKRLPHRYPFLFVDKIEEVVLGESLIAIKNVSINEPYFMGHFPQRPVMPGVLIIEALAQACGVLTFISAQAGPEHEALYYLAGVNDARFKRVVEPGDTLRLHVKMTKHKLDLWKFDTFAEVNGELACSAELINVRREIKK